MMNRRSSRSAEHCIGLAAAALALSLLYSADLSAECRLGNENPWITPTAAAIQFDARDDGTVVHNPSRLVWQRCALGQTWSGSDCNGTPLTMSWDEALNAAETHIQDGRDDWRLPNRNELVSILEFRCFLPTVDNLVFPNAPSGAHWTSSPVSDAVDESWIVDFDDGLTEPASTAGLFKVRLVRGGWD